MNNKDDTLNNILAEKEKKFEQAKKECEIESGIEYIATAFRKDEQTVVAIEEMAELTKELCKAQRGKENKEELTEELADVIIMLEQIKIYYRISPKTLNDMILDKIDRTKRIAKIRQEVLGVDEDDT